MKEYHEFGFIKNSSSDNFYIYCPVTELKYIVEDTREYMGHEYICHVAMRCSNKQIVSLEEIYDQEEKD